MPKFAKDVQSLLDQLPFAVFLKDVQGRYVLANSVACHVVGRAFADVVGKTDFDLVPRAFAEKIWLHDNELRRNGSVEPREDTRLVAGETRKFLVHKVRPSMVNAPDGWVLGYAIDITALRQAEHTLLEEQEFINQVLDTAPNLVFVKDREDKFVLVNQAVANLYGKSKSEMLQRTNTELNCHPSETAAYLEDSRYVLETRTSIRSDKSHTLPSGEVLWFDVLKAPLVRRDGTVHVLGISTDVTARKRAEQSHIDSEAQIRALLDAIPDHLIVVDANGVCVRSRPDVSRPAAEQICLEPGQSVLDALPTHFAKAMLAAQARIRAGESLVSFEHVWTQNVIRRDYDVRCTGLPDGRAMFLIRDITERKEIERMKDEFVAVVSHELRTPLTALTGSLKLLTSGIVGELEEGPRELIDIALEGSERLVRLVNDILNIDKIERGGMKIELESVRVRTTIAHAIAESDALAQKNALQLQFVGAPDVFVRANEAWLRHVFGNLLSNAIKFSSNGQVIEVEVFEGSWVRIEVRDRGPGISAEFRSRLFQKFAQADSSSNRGVGGTGLGLSICKSVVEQMGGRIGQINRPSGGSIFFVELLADHG